MYAIINAQLFACQAEYPCIFSLESELIAMYRASTASQIRFDDFNQGCGMQLDKNNEWIRMGDLIILHYYNNMQLKEIALKLHMSYSNCKLVHNKALMKLHQYLA